MYDMVYRQTALIPTQQYKHCIVHQTTKITVLDMQSYKVHSLIMQQQQISKKHGPIIPRDKPTIPRATHLLFIKPGVVSVEILHCRVVPRQKETLAVAERESGLAHSSRPQNYHLVLLHQLILG